VTNAVAINTSRRLQQAYGRCRGCVSQCFAHDVLGPRLSECTRLVMTASEKRINDIFGSPDDMKFRSSMTLFDAVSNQEIFAETIGMFYPEGPDPATLEILRYFDN
jgi:uncharacterized protein (DUF1810 family)